eukprot:TRINITY_DN1144_c0_g1_i1.p1 TRINITY_DN1144_c0_g1~~TRINITY_DN1144_c0_g1_i1.p1  ORF type:complete len:132 (+),score=21.81 TRINITY_DN1144_c0_g1_i1:31-426(+)
MSIIKGIAAFPGTNPSPNQKIRLRKHNFSVYFSRNVFNGHDWWVHFGVACVSTTLAVTYSLRCLFYTPTLSNWYLTPRILKPYIEKQRYANEGPNPEDITYNPYFVKIRQYGHSTSLIEACERGEAKYGKN